MRHLAGQKTSLLFEKPLLDNRHIFRAARTRMLSLHITQPQTLSNQTSSKEKTSVTNISTEVELMTAARRGRPPPEWLITGVDLNALACAASEALSTDEVPKITFEGDGGYNRLFLLTFEKQRNKILARVAKKNARTPCSIPSAVAAMSFARHVQGIPAPEVYAWNPTADNAVGAPYILQEYVDNVVEPDELFDKGSDEQRALILHELARWHAAFLAPLPPALQGIGQLAFAPNLPSGAALSDPRSYVLRPPPITLSKPWDETPRYWVGASTSIEDMWTELYGLRRCMAMPTDSSLNLEELDLEKEQAQAESCNAASFSVAASHALSYIRQSLSKLRTAPLPFSASCLFRGDYAFRNVLLDAYTLHVRAFIDWDDVCVKPLVLAINFPQDIMRFNVASLDRDCTYFRNGSFRQLPPDEFGDLLDLFDEHGNYKELDEEGNPTYIDERNEGIRNTTYRRQYIEYLKTYDRRTERNEMWELRKCLVKAEYLASYGGDAWWDKRDWLQEQIESASESKHRST